MVPWCNQLFITHTLFLRLFLFPSSHIQGSPRERSEELAVFCPQENEKVVCNAWLCNMCGEDSVPGHLCTLHPEWRRVDDEPGKCGFPHRASSANSSGSYHKPCQGQQAWKGAGWVVMKGGCRRRRKPREAPPMSQ